jgi:putative drug exporter of the RND superfamily
MAMFLKGLNKFVIKFKFPIIIFWVLITGIVFFTAPVLSEVSKGDTESLLAKDTDAVKSASLMKSLYPNKGNSSSLIIILTRKGPINNEDRVYISRLEAYLNSKSSSLDIKKINSPFSNKELEDTMLSIDKKAAIIEIDLNTSGFLDITNEAVNNIRKDIKSGNNTGGNFKLTIPQGLTVNITGDAALGQEQMDNIKKSLNMTVKITLILIIIILLLIYKSPIAPILPLATIGISFLISRGIIAALTNLGLKVSSFTELFLIAVLFGAGTDYCLLLISRYKEELVKGKSPRDALIVAFPGTGIAIVSSGITIIIGFSAMAFAKFALFNTTGPSIAIGVGVTILAVLTLTPALISILGEKIFWPISPSNTKGLEVVSSPFWNRLAKKVTTNPMRFLIISIIIFIPFMLSAAKVIRSFDNLGELPSKSDTVVGFNALKAHFNQGEMLPVKVVLRSDKNLWTSGALQAIDNVAIGILKVDGTIKVRTATRPNGEQINETSLNKQIGELAKGLGSLDNNLFNVTTGLEKADEGLKQIIPVLNNISLSDYKVRDDLKAAVVNLNNVYDGLNKSKMGIEKIRVKLGDAMDMTNSYSKQGQNLNNVFYLPEGAFSKYPKLKEYMGDYISPNNKGVMFDIILSLPPYDPRALDSIAHIKTAIDFSLKGGFLEKSEFYVGGSTEAISELRQITASDFINVMFFVLLGIFIVLGILLRSLIAPIYLIITNLISYGTTIGISYLVFQVGFGKEGLSWSVPFFSFCLLVALGVDYNIFLMTRIREEYIPGGVTLGVERALSSTGKIITSCGIIMVGTFGAMMFSPVTQLVQIGFTTVVGLILDTFVIRTLLVPAIVVKFGELNWWPGQEIKVISVKEEVI